MAAHASDVVLCLARPQDALEIALLSRREVEYGFHWSWTVARVARSIADRETNVVVARAGALLAGFGIMRYRGDDAHLELFAVHPEHRRQGLGRQLLAWLEKPAVVGGFAMVWLEVRASNEGAQAFYERLGYRRLLELPGYYEGREAAVRMGRPLT